MSDQVHISAQIPASTKRRLDECAVESGLSTDEIIEAAIEEHLDVLEQIPPQYIIPRRIVLTNDSFDQMLKMINEPGEPTPALVELMRKSRLHSHNQ